MPRVASLTFEQLQQVVDSPITAKDLATGMVWGLRRVILVTCESTKSGPMVVVNSRYGLHRFALDAQIDVWHLYGEPLIVNPPPEDFGIYIPGVSGGSTQPMQDAAGIVPVWRGPNRLN